MLKSCETYSASSINAELLGAISKAAAAAVRTSLSRRSAPATNPSLHQSCSSFIVSALSNIKKPVFAADVRFLARRSHLIWTEGFVLPTLQALWHGFRSYW